MSALEWAFTAAVVLAGSTLQAVTGMGLGLLIGPVLILVMDSVAGITVAVVLNLLVSVVLLPRELRDVDAASMLPLLAGCVLGIPPGLWVLASADIPTLKLMAGIAVSLAAVQLLVRSRRAPAADAGRSGLAAPVTIGAAGLLAGIMTACLAMPGPALMWGMGQMRLPARAIRANLRVLFCVTYSLTLGSHLLGGVDVAEFAFVAAALAPALLAGAVAGHYAKAWVSERALRIALEIILLVMGVSLLAGSLPL